MIIFEYIFSLLSTYKSKIQENLKPFGIRSRKKFENSRENLYAGDDDAGEDPQHATQMSLNRASS